MKTNFETTRNRGLIFFMILLFLTSILCALFLPGKPKDPQVTHPNEIKFLTVDGDTAIIKNWGHVIIEIHKK
jgi:hypothetical protein